MGVDNSNLNSTTGLTLKPTFGKTDNVSATGGAAFKSALEGSPVSTGAGLQSFSGAQTISTATGYALGKNSSKLDGTAFGAGVNPLPGSLAGGSGLGGGTGSTGIPGIGGAGNAVGGASGGGDSQSQLMAATQQMQETQMSFNLQYLQLQNNMQQDNRVYTTMSNVMKTKHDTVKNSISNIR